VSAAVSWAGQDELPDAKRLAEHAVQRRLDDAAVIVDTAEPAAIATSLHGQRDATNDDGDR
jgi:hypothetical protein